MKQKNYAVNNIKFEIEELLPAVRASATKVMANRYGLKQEDVATLLGLTQAAVSKYLNDKYSEKIKSTENKFDKKILNKLVKYMVMGESQKARETICEICRKSYPTQNR
ncbi:MAG: helix-turn-helix domain-containing protein [Candidatus Marsarchaeota archaeon]|nr:helix-turn-helix domain-containing protein [Candidatus Marsarchaeota archaeon]MCL5089739.1 helix-turn-helix domain-containing protein [Candidatus Marsarchaeota archaeon]